MSQQPAVKALVPLRPFGLEQHESTAKKRPMKEIFRYGGPLETDGTQTAEP